jgi:hypothetical protein
VNSGKLADALGVLEKMKLGESPYSVRIWRPHGIPNQPRLSSGSLKPSYGRDGAERLDSDLLHASGTEAENW